MEHATQTAEDTRQDIRRQSSEDARRAFRGVAGHLASGVTVVVAMVGGAPHAATASSGVVASVEPPLVALFFAVGSRMHGAVAASNGFTVNVLGAADHGVARRFANPGRAAGWAGFAGLDIVCRDPAPPILARATAWFDCRLREIVPMGDHACFVGEVVACDRDQEAAPLVYHRGRFHGLGRPVAPARWAALDRSDLGADW